MEWRKKMKSMIQLHVNSKFVKIEKRWCFSEKLSKLMVSQMRSSKELSPHCNIFELQYPTQYSSNMRNTYPGF